MDGLSLKTEWVSLGLEKYGLKQTFWHNPSTNLNQVLLHPIKNRSNVRRRESLLTVSPLRFNVVVGPPEH